MSLTDIFSEIAKYQCRLVEITGGEPLLQPDTPKLIHRLIKKGFEVMLETNGTFDTSNVDKRTMKIIDIKCPSSNESDKNNFINLKRLTTNDQIKFVIGTREDFEYAKNILETYRPKLPIGNILFSPVFNILSGEELAKWILEENLNVRLQLQLHKFIWPNKDRGV